MKNPTITQPRFTCRLVRGCLAVFGDTATGVPRGPGATHVAACADCQQFFATCDELERALKVDATRQWHDAPAGLEQNIIRAVHLSVSPVAPRNTRVAWMSLAAAAACALVAVLVYQQRTAPGVSATTVRKDLAVSGVDSATLAAAREIIATVPGDLLAQMQPQAQAILQQNPLQNEVEAMKSDARSAVRFLALNFLPAPASDTSSGE